MLDGDIFFIIFDKSEFVHMHHISTGSQSICIFKSYKNMLYLCICFINKGVHTIMAEPSC